MLLVSFEAMAIATSKADGDNFGIDFQCSSCVGIFGLEEMMCCTPIYPMEEFSLFSFITVLSPASKRE